MLSKSADRFCPIRATKQQNDRAPVNAPKHDIDPSHDTCTEFNGSVSICDVFDVNCGKAGLSQPITQPCVKVTKLAVNEKMHKIECKCIPI